MNPDYIFNILTLIGGLCIFLFGMNTMGESLERRAGNKLRGLLSKLTSNKIAGLLTGLAVTAVIQSSSATTVMVVGFVNSGLMTLSQAINVIMGANIGTTITAWILSLTGIESGNFFIKMLKPMSFTPILALIGIIFYMFCKSQKKKDTGMILLGFATLMFGMDIMSDSVKFLETVDEFTALFTMFKNPIMGMLAGVVLTAIIQLSSASVGILQALSVTGKITYGAAIPIIMGQNIGTCITAVLSSIGATKNAKRAAAVHLFFNIIGAVVWITVFWIGSIIFNPIILEKSASGFGIAICHSIFNLLCMFLLLPMSKFLEKLVIRLIPDNKTPEKIVELDERLLATPPIALQRCREISNEMAICSMEALKQSIYILNSYSKQDAERIREFEEKSDYYEDILGSYLVKLSTKVLSSEDTLDSALMLKAIGDFERISDHSINILESAEEMRDKNLSFSDAAKKELNVLTSAILEILDKTMDSYINNNYEAVSDVEPLEQVIDKLKEELRLSHIYRLQQSDCSIETGFVWNDLLTNFERVSDHCSNIAGGVIERTQHNLNIHESLRTIKLSDAYFKDAYNKFLIKYSLDK
ncbi:MAG: Na/Pi cotransporter family protein [Clostridia bacterium]|nr:Na/Pi cotransporter family protein [Clostridia bacterium]